MKILLINSEYPPIGGGAGNASENIARLLVKMGNEVFVLTSRFGNLPHEELCGGVRILRGPAFRQFSDRSTAMEQSSFIVGASIRAFSLLRHFKPDVTLAFFGLPSGAVAWLLKIVLGVPYVVSLRGGDVPGFRPYDFWLYHKLAVPFLHVIWRNASTVVANSKGLHDLATAFDSTIDIPIVPNGVDVERYSMIHHDWSPPRILSVGRVVYQKGYDLALLALAGLKDLEWEWRIAGDGPQLASLHTLIEKHDLQERVHFLGWQTTEQLKKQYAEANLFLFPSRHEGMPNAVLEAMASGLAVVATSIAGNEELVVDGETGALVPVEDADALRGALRPFLSEAKMREKMGSAARPRVERLFPWTRVAEEYQLILEKAMK